MPKVTPKKSAPKAPKSTGLVKKPNLNAASKKQVLSPTKPVQNYFASKSVMKPKGKGY